MRNFNSNMDLGLSIDTVIHDLLHVLDKGLPESPERSRSLFLHQG